MDLQLIQKWHKAGDTALTLDEINKLVPVVEDKLLCAHNPTHVLHVLSPVHNWNF